MRNLTARLIAPILKISGYRFSKYHRQYETGIYRLVNTVLANMIADGVH